MKDCYVVSTRELEMNSDSGAFDSLGPSTPVAAFPTLEEAEQYRCAYMRWWLATANVVVIGEYLSVQGIYKVLSALDSANFTKEVWTASALAAALKIRPLSDKQIKSLCSELGLVRLDTVPWSPLPLRVPDRGDTPAFSTSSIRI